MSSIGPYDRFAFAPDCHHAIAQDQKTILKDKIHQFLENHSYGEDKELILSLFEWCELKLLDDAIWTSKISEEIERFTRKDEFFLFLLKLCPDEYRDGFWKKASEACTNITSAKLLIETCPKENQSNLWNREFFSVAIRSEERADFVPLLIENCPKEHQVVFWKHPDYRFNLQALFGKCDLKLARFVINKCPKELQQDFWKFRHLLDIFNRNKTLIPLFLRECPKQLQRKCWKKAYRNLDSQFQMESTTVDSLANHYPDDAFIQSRKVDGDKKRFYANYIDFISQEQHGFKFYNFFLIPPYSDISQIAEFWPMDLPKPPLLEYMCGKVEKYRRDKEILLGDLMQRILERYPTFEPPAAEQEEIKEFVEQVLVSKNLFLGNMIRYDYKMNQSIPLSLKALNQILRALERCEKNKEKRHAFRSALQTYTYSELIYSVVDVDQPIQSFPSKAEFFKLPLEEQRGLMCRAQVLRQCDALAAAGHVLKQAVREKTFDRDLLIFSLMLYKQTEVEGSKNLYQRLALLFLNCDLDVEIRKQAALAFSKVEQDPSNSERKQQLCDAYFNAKQADLKSVFLEALLTYNFTSSDADKVFGNKLVEESKTVKDSNLKKSIAYVLTLIPSQDALKESLNIVNSDVWDEIEKMKMASKEQMIWGGYSVFCYRPSYHDSRSSMRRIIAERIVLLYREDKRQSIEFIYASYVKKKASFPRLEKVEDYIRLLIEDRDGAIVATPDQDEIRYHPVNIYLPKGVVYRGLSERKGIDLMKRAHDDLFLKGLGSIDLTFCSYDNGSWAKMGHVFTSVSLSYLMQFKFFDKNGILLFINSDMLNESLLRRDVRIETERSLHYVKYGLFKLRAIVGVLMPETRRDLINQVKDEKDRPKAEKVMRRNLIAKQGNDCTLEDRVTYFDPDKSDLELHIRSLLKQAKQEEIETDAIVKVNVERQIARLLVANDLKDSELKACLQLSIDQYDSFG